MSVRIELVVISDSETVDDKECKIREEVDDWTENREWVKGTQLIRAPFDRHCIDFRRMCRRVTGRSIG